jgi:hypothetical protein
VAPCSVSIGAYALKVNQGDGNTAIGNCAGCTNTSGVKNIFIGHGAILPSPTTEYSAQLGNSSMAVLRTQVAPTVPSDERDKKDISTLPIGLEFIQDIRPVKFVWNMRDGGKVNIKDTGFIAQEVDEIVTKYNVADWLSVISKENLDKLMMAPGKLVPVIVKAIQEIADKRELDIANLKLEIEELKKKL